MSTKIENKTGGIGIGGLMFIVFLTLKLGVGSTAVMNWSWWWVCAPLWIPLCFVLSVLTIIALVWGIMEIIKPHYPFSRRKFSKVKKLRKSFQKKNIDFDQFATAMDKVMELSSDDRFELMDFDEEKSTKKSIRRHKEKTSKERFSIKRWWKDGVQGQTLWQKVGSWYRNGNKKVAEKKAAKSEKNS